MLDIKKYSDKDGYIDVPNLLRALADLMEQNKSVYFDRFDQKEYYIASNKACKLTIELIGREWIITNKGSGVETEKYFEDK
jgi:hypothetical protein